MHTDTVLDYQNLGPDEVLAAVESRGYICDGHLLVLNSFENRVYQVGVEDNKALIAKFYRPHRWNDAMIGEEHTFALELAADDIALIAPIADTRGETLFQYGSYRFALFPRRGGRAPDLENPEHQRQLGRFIGRLHARGCMRAYEHRPTLDVTTFGVESCQFILAHDFIPKDLEAAYQSLTEDLIQQIGWCYERAGSVDLIRTHGDCHIGNILWRDNTAHFVDLDDCCTAPAVQDLWMQDLWIEVRGLVGFI